MLETSCRVSSRGIPTRSLIARYVDKTEAARGSLNKVRTLMLMRMRQVLRPDQRVRFKALHERWDRERQLQDARIRRPEQSGPR